jgi:hypothetical protein
MCRSGNVLRGDPGSFVRRTAGQAGPPFTLPITTSPPLKPHALNAPWQFNPAPIVIRLVRIRHSAKHPRLNAPLLHRPGLVRFSIPEFDRVRLAGPVGGDGAFCAWRSSGGAFSAQTLAGGSWIVSGRACRTGILERRAEGRLDGVSVGGRATQGSKFVRPPNRGTGGTAVYAPNHHIPSAQKPRANAPWQFNPAATVVRLVRIRHSAKHPQLNALLLHRPGIVRFSIPKSDQMPIGRPSRGATVRLAHGV